MALPILDGNQSATTLSTILSSGQHITAHTVVSLGTQAITDMRGAVSGSVVSVSSLPAISGTVTANGVAFNEGEVTPDKAIWIAYNSDNTLQGVGNSAPLPISGTVTANLNNVGGGYFTLYDLFLGEQIPVVASLASGLEQIGSVTASLSAGTNRIGVVTIGAGTVTIGAGTAQIGSVTASISGTVPVSISSVTVGNSVTIGSLPAISGTVTANTFAVQGTAVTTSNFTSTTASTVLANYNATRQVLTIFNEGAGNLHIAPGATCTTIAYQVRLSAGDYYEVPNHQTTITHSAVFATAGTARVTQVS
jgi:hypothetical protein